MKENINFSRFTSAFREMNRKDNFSYNGLNALYEYLTDLEDDTGQEIELDVIALCCDYNEYKDLNEYLNDYSANVLKEDFETEGEFNAEGYHDAIKEEIENKTTLLMFGDDLNEGFIIQAY